MFPEHTWNIHVYGDTPLNRARQEIEDDIIDRVDEFAEVTGGGSEDSEWNIDVEVFDGEQIEYCYDTVSIILLEAGADPGSPIQIIRTEHRELVRE